jgi:hypothetical protein
MKNTYLLRPLTLCKAKGLQQSISGHHGAHFNSKIGGGYSNGVAFKQENSAQCRRAQKEH